MRILLLSLLLSTLTNADVMKLVKAGLSPETIEAKIAASATEFDTSTEALVALAESGVPDRVIRTMIGAKPAPAAPASVRAVAAAPAPVRAVAPATPAPVRAVAPKPLPSRRYDVTVHGDNGGKCDGELRVDARGLKMSRCGTLDFELPWTAVTPVCHDYGFRGALLVDGRRLSTTTPAEAKRIVEHVRARVPVAACAR